MKINLKFYDTNDDLSGKYETSEPVEAIDEVEKTEYERASIRFSYDDGSYNEASFNNLRDAKLLIALFSPRSLIEYLRRNEI